MTIDYVAQKGQAKDVQLNSVLGDYKRKINEIIDEINAVPTLSEHASRHEVDGEDLVSHDSLTDFLATEHYLQSAITTVGIIGTGEWKGTPIINAYIAGINQDLLKASSPTFVTAKLTGLTDGYVPYHVNDATGLANSPIFIDGAKVGIGVSPGNVLHVAGNIQVNSTGQKIHSNIWEVVSSTANMKFRISSQDAMIIQKTTRNVGIGTATFGTSAVRVFGIGNGTAPSTSPADMVQLWSEDIVADHAQLHYRAEGGIARPLNRLYDVSDWGMISDDNSGSVPADNVTAWNTIIGDVAAGDKIYIPKGTWYTNDDLAVSQSVTIFGDGEVTVIKQEVDAKRGFDISVSNVLVKDLQLQGTGTQADMVGNSDAIRALGSVGSYLSNIKIVRVKAYNWKQYGIYLGYVSDFIVDTVRVDSVVYAGIMMFSSQYGRVHHSYINNITCHSNGDGYGIVATRQGGVAEATSPRSKHIDIDHNIVRGVTEHEGIDTHGGEYIIIDANQVYDTDSGIVCTDIALDSGVIVSKNITITNNIVDSEQGDGSRKTGIEVGCGSWEGGAGVTGTSAVITGNTIRRHGIHSVDPAASPRYGGICTWQSDGLVISLNRLIECSPVAINIYDANRNFICIGNTIQDPWALDTDLDACYGIAVSGGSNTGYISGNPIRRGAFTISNGEYIDDANGVGILVANSAGNDVQLGQNKSEATTLLADAGNKTVVRFEAPYIRMGFHNAAKFIIYDASGAERASLLLGTTTLSINADSDIYMNPNNTTAGTFKAAGQLELVENLDMANNKQIRFKDAGGIYQYIMSFSSSDDLEIGAGADSIRLIKNTKIGTNADPAAPLDVHGDGIIGGIGDTTKLALHNATVERAFLQLCDANGTSVQLNSDGAVKFYPNNVYRGSFLADGGVIMSGLKSGATQPGSVVAGELWVDTDDQTIKMGV